MASASSPLKCRLFVSRAIPPSHPLPLASSRGSGSAWRRKARRTEPRPRPPLAASSTDAGLALLRGRDRWVWTPRHRVRPAAPVRDFRSGCQETGLQFRNSLSASTVGSVRSDRCWAFRWAVGWRVVFLLAESNARRSGDAVQDQAERDDHNHGLSDQRALLYLAFLDHDQAEHECSNPPGAEPSHEQFAAPRQTATSQCDRE